MIYPPELEVKETADTASSASFLDLYLEFDDSGQISTKNYDKRDDFNFKIINFPIMCSNIPASPAYGVYIYLNFPIVNFRLHLYVATFQQHPHRVNISQLIRYSRACGCH
jgi:hypothetical protein